MTMNKTAINQDIESLLAISNFSFDINDEKFVEYFQSRTGQMITLCDCGMDNVKKLLIRPPNTSWKLTKAKLQDCWEIYKNE